MARVNKTKQEIIGVASKLCLTKGYSETSPKMICDELGISTGNLTYYFPTKEHLLAELVKLLCKYQYDILAEEANDGISEVLSESQGKSKNFSKNSHFPIDKGAGKW